MRGLLHIWLLTCVLLLGACGEPGKYYDKSPEAVFAAIEEARIPVSMLTSKMVGKTVSRPAHNLIVVTANDHFGGDIVRFVTKVTPEGNGSRVIGRFEAGSLKPPAERQQLLDKAVQEFAEAAIEDRPFNVLFASPTGEKLPEDIQKRMEWAHKNPGKIDDMESQVREIERQMTQDYPSDWNEQPAELHDGWASE